jgi:hypothetical protein
MSIGLKAEQRAGFYIKPAGKPAAGGDILEEAARGRGLLLPI